MNLHTQERLAIQQTIPAQSRIYNAILTCIVTVLLITHLMLPIERGISPVQILGFPVSITMLISLFSLILIVFTNPERNTLHFTKYVVLQLLFVCFALASSLWADDPEKGGYVAVQYGIVFIANFWILFEFFRKGYFKRFALIIAIVAVLAAGVGIMEGIGVPIQFYRNIRAFTEPGFLDLEKYNPQALNRVFGTLGNPIVYSVALALCVPFVIELRWKRLRILFLLVILIAIFFSVTFTSLILISFLLMKLIIRLDIKKLLLGGIIIYLTFFVLLPQIPEFQEPFELWSHRLSFSDPTTLFQRVNIADNLLNMVLDRKGVQYLLFGNGVGSQALRSQLALSGSNTVDNTYLEILYTFGITGFFMYSGVCLTTTFDNRRGMRDDWHWYSVAGFLLAGFSFVTVYYSTFNLIWVASVAALEHKKQEYTGPIENSRSNI